MQSCCGEGLCYVRLIKAEKGAGNKICDMKSEYNSHYGQLNRNKTFVKNPNQPLVDPEVMVKPCTVAQELRGNVRK